MICLEGTATGREHLRTERETLQDDVKQMSLLICCFLVVSGGEYYFPGLFLVGLS